MKPVELWQKILRDLGRDDLVRQRPWPGFDSVFYWTKYPDIAGQPDPLAHFQNHGRGEGRIGTRYKDLRRHFPRIDQALENVVFHSLIEQAFAEQMPSVHEVLFELILLGDPIDREVSNFSSRYYLSLYPDIAAIKAPSAEHYLCHGFFEGRRSLADVRNSHLQGGQTFDPARPTCLICLNEMSRTGAPVVGLKLVADAAKTHNVVVMALKGGPLLDDIRGLACEVLLTLDPLNDSFYLSSQVMERVSAAVLNSVVAARFIPMLLSRGIPFASYLHEYADYVQPAQMMHSVSLYSDLLVFSSAQVRGSWSQVFADTGFDIDRDSIILPQERISFRPVPSLRMAEARKAVGRLLGTDCTDRRIIYGAGYIQPRKGTDWFVMAAQIARAQDPDALYVWIGDGANHEEWGFGVWLDKHLRELGANRPGANLFFLPAGPHYDDLRHAADALFLSSRLDPLPNVVFDAFEAGCRVVAFKTASGFDDPEYDCHTQLVNVPYGDVQAASLALSGLHRKTGATEEAPASAEAQTPASPVFDGILHALRARCERQDYFAIGPGAYDHSHLFSGAAAAASDRRREREKVWSYRRNLIWRSPAEAEAQIAASDSWFHDRMQIVSVPGDGPDPDAGPDEADLPAYSIHVHAESPDTLREDLQAHVAFHHAERIVVTVGADKQVPQIARLAQITGLPLEPRLHRGPGRDIRPFLELAGADEDGLWCHYHQALPGPAGKGKRHINAPEQEARMRLLLGDPRSAGSASRELARPGIGLVAAFDFFIAGWSTSLRVSGLLADRLPGPLPEHPLLFPGGGMYWVRGSVVRRMAQVLGPDYPWPNDPLPQDGTIFQLISRLWPAAARMAGLNAVFLETSEEKVPE